MGPLGSLAVEPGVKRAKEGVGECSQQPLGAEGQRGRVRQGCAAPGEALRTGPVCDKSL